MQTNCRCCQEEDREKKPEGMTGKRRRRKGPTVPAMEGNIIFSLVSHCVHTAVEEKGGNM